MTQMAKHEELPIPIHNTLDAVYGDSSQLDEAQLRFHRLKSKFQQVGHPPHLFARSSGRVNLIGEHIDYERYSMLPMAIRQDTVVAIRKHDDGDAAKVLRIANVNDKYQICTYPADPTQLTKPYAADSTPGQDDCADEKPSVKIPEIAGKVESGIRSPGLQCMSPDYDTKEIKNIYVDCCTQCTRLPLYAGSGRGECRLALPPLFLPFIRIRRDHGVPAVDYLTPSPSSFIRAWDRQCSGGKPVASRKVDSPNHLFTIISLSHDS